MAETNITITDAKVTGKGVEMKMSAKGTEYAEFTIMWGSGRKNKQGEREYGPTKFVKVRVGGFDAKDVAASVQPGDRVNVEGRIEHFTWQSNEGEKDDWSMWGKVSLPVPRAGEGFQSPAQQQQQPSFGGGFQESAPF